MPIQAVLGCQWGDEGKGKVVDLLSEDADWVARFQGGANAGHTILIEGKQTILHLVPTGILRPGVNCAIGNGVVLDPLSLVEEIHYLEEQGVDCRNRLRISPFAHVVTPLHTAVEAITAQDRTIGTTRRGIGPAYAEKVTRRGLRVEDLVDSSRAVERLSSLWIHLCSIYNMPEQAFANAAGGSLDRVAERLEDAGRFIAPMVADVTDLLLDEDDRGKRILCEGAQGAWLDIDHGTYPYVTSSNTTIGGVCTGLGLPPGRIERVIGVLKAYTTRVGLGPFPTEFAGEMADRFREKAGEFGATTQRPRRCGWFDAVLARRSCRINGIDELFVTKLDVLTGLPQLRLAVDYAWDRERTEGAEPHPAWLSPHRLEDAIPQYREMQPWSDDLTALRSWSKLPAAAHGYLDALAAETGVGIGRVSVGPGREAVVPVGT